MSNITNSNRDIKSLQLLAQVAAQLFLDECKSKNIDIFVTEYHRSQERQNYLYEQGRTRPGQVVTWTKSSNHTSGYAWDIACNPPNALYDSKIIAKAGQVAKTLGIEWGGDWKTPDTPHFQISKEWQEPVKVVEDTALKDAVSKIIDSGININAASWSKVDNINLKNVPALINKFGGIAELVEKNVISSPTLWVDGTYSRENVRSLLIKYSVKLG